MTIEAIIELLLQHGSLGIFAGYLIFESHRLRKQQGETVLSFTESIDKLRGDAADNEKDLRLRYDNVITQITSEKEQAKTVLSDKVKGLSSRIAALEKKTENILVQLETINSTLQEIKLRELVRTEKKR